ncbi:MAG: hypothetical protein GX307_01325 [Euryarchaeota archaeon]|nr:hypothetical protein [Euryarchaeota archaeon]
MLEATIIVRPLESWAIDISKRLGTPIRIIESAMGQDGVISSIVEFRLDGTSKEEILEEITRHPDTSDFLITRETDDTILGDLTVKKWMAGQALQRKNCYVVGARTMEQGAMEWRLLVTEEPTLRSLVQDLEEAGCKVSLRRKRQINDFNILTKRQEMVVEKALEMGYFDYPRGVTGRELARRLDISQSTLYETLQNSQRKLVEAYLIRRRMK